MSFKKLYANFRRKISFSSGNLLKTCYYLDKKGQAQRKGEIAMTISPLLLCNNFLNKSLRDGYEITPMKLQKLLYFLCREYLQKYEKPLITEPFSVWQYGPVLESVYMEFKSFGAKAITKYAKDAQGKSLMVDEDSFPELAQSINDVWAKYKGYTGIELSKITHKPGSGWYSAYQRRDSVISKEDMINDKVC